MEDRDRGLDDWATVRRHRLPKARTAVVGGGGPRGGVPGGGAGIPPGGVFQGGQGPGQGARRAGAPGAGFYGGGQGGQGRGAGWGPQYRPPLPKASLGVRPNTACLFRDSFLTLPSEGELQDWLVDKVFLEAEGQVRDTVFLGFKYLRLDLFKKRFLITFNEEDHLRDFLNVFESHGAQGVLWPGSDVKVKAQAMEELTLEIILLDVDPETDDELVKSIMAKYGRVVRCERMKLSGPFSHVKVNKMKVELVRNKVQLPNVIHSFGTRGNVDDFLIWKLQYPGCPRYCFLCGDARHEARQCGQRGITRGQLEEMKCAVGEVQEIEEGDEAGSKGPKLTYAAVLKDPAFLAKQLQERREKAEKDREEQEARDRKKEDNRKREEENRNRRIAKRDEELLNRQRATEELERQNDRERKAFNSRKELILRARHEEGNVEAAETGQDLQEHAREDMEGVQEQGTMQQQVMVQTEAEMQEQARVQEQAEVQEQAKVKGRAGVQGEASGKEQAMVQKVQEPEEAGTHSMVQVENGDQDQEEKVQDSTRVHEEAREEELARVQPEISVQEEAGAQVKTHLQNQKKARTNEAAGLKEQENVQTEVTELKNTSVFTDDRLQEDKLKKQANAKARVQGKPGLKVAGDIAPVEVQEVDGVEEKTSKRRASKSPA